MQGSNKSKHETITDAAIGVVTASLKTREHNEGHHTVNGTPLKLSKGDWRVVLVGTARALSGKNLPTLAAGVAYYSTLAFFPFLAAGAAIAALLISSEQLESLISATESYVPNAISGVVTAQLESIASSRADNFLAAIIALLVALFGASGASKSLVTASNMAYGVKESRGWLTQQFWGVIWTVFGIVFGASALALIAVNQMVLGHLGIPSEMHRVLLYGRWLLLILMSMSVLATFYKYGPNRPHVHWQWVSWGAAIATVAWLMVTSLFFTYVQSFAHYTQSYSLFAGVIILMIWLNLSAVIVLVGAEINHQLEQAGHKRWGGLFHRKH
jgi:membrane protein